MKILVAHHPLIAAFILSSPLIAQAQVTPTDQRPSTPANSSRAVDRLTLLRGPGLLSPATATETRGSDRSTSGKATEAEVLEARQKLEETRAAKLKKLQAERAAALQRKKELDEAVERSLQQEAELKRLDEMLREGPNMSLPKDPVRFDGRLPDLPKSLLPKPGTATGTIRFVPETKP